MIYFDSNKKAYAYEIENPICSISDTTWHFYAGTDKWDIVNGEFVDITNTPEWQEKHAREERERLDALTLTRGDVFDALIKARMIDESYVLSIIEEMPEETDEQKLTKMLSRNACQNALNFHRSHPMVDYIGGVLNISSHNLDMFFDTNDYHYLLAEMEGN